MKITLKRTSPQYRQKLSTIEIMKTLLCVSSLLCVISVGYNFIFNGTNYGIKAILIFVVSAVVSLLTDAISGKLFHRNDEGDNKILNTVLSPLETGLIYALTLPIGTPLYVVGVGAFVAVFFGKAIFGGFGQNIFNPALVGRVFVHLSFSSKLTTYLSEGSDIVSSATPTTALAATNWVGKIDTSLVDLFLGKYQGALGETFTLFILLAGIFLAYKKVLDARIPVAYLGTVFVLAFISGLVTKVNPLTNALIHISIGGVALGAVFMATDPVTSPTSPLGKIIYGILLGMITMLIRLKANYPEGVLFSILIMNMFTPFIDSVTTGRTNQKMAQQWLIIGVCLLVSIGSIAGVSTTLEPVKEKEEKPVEAIPDVAYLEYKDGAYIMQVKGFGGDKYPVKLAINIVGDKCLGVTPMKYKGETEGYGASLLESGQGEGLNDQAKIFYDQVIKGSVSKEDLSSIDTATGATYTAKAVVNAIQGAFDNQPVVNGDEYTFTIKANGFGGKSNPMTLEIVANKATSTIEKVTVKEATGETEYYGANLLSGRSSDALDSTKAKAFYDQVLNSPIAFDQVEGIDTATGATMTSTGIKDALQSVVDQMSNQLTPNEDGAYEITSTGFDKNTPMKIAVKITGDQVEYVHVLEYAGETEYYGANLITGKSSEALNSKAKTFYDQVLNSSFSVSEVDGIDTSTGATYTSTGIKDAIKKAVALGS